MSGKRGQGPADNPWVRDTAGTPEAATPPEVPARPDPGPEGPGWGAAIAPPSLRRPESEPKRRLLGTVLPIAVGVAVLALATVGLGWVLGRDDRPSSDPPPPPVSTGPSSGTPTGPTTPVPTSKYTPPANAIPVGFGVSVVPAQGWNVYAAETKGKQLVVPAPGGYRSWFWIRQRQNISAKDYVVRIVEGEITQGKLPRMSATRNLVCPRDVLVECNAISYSMTSKLGVRLEGYVEAYRRKDGVVTAIDFITRPDFAGKAYADAQVMKQSVIDSL